MAQYARPTSDKADDGNWTGQAGESEVFYTEIDESSASDSDYIEGDGSLGSDIEIDFELTNGLSSPGVTTGHKLIYRYNTDAGSSDASLTVKLMEGGSTRMSETVDISGVSSFTTRTYAPTNTTGTISSYDNVFLRIIFNDSEAMDNVYVSQAYLEVPDAASTTALPMAMNTYKQLRNY